MDNAPDNEHIKDSLYRTYMYILEHEAPLVSISGGADSDVILDLCYMCDIDKKCSYVWCDTGLEYKATKEHLAFLEEKYGITIQRKRPLKSIPYTCYTVGQPFGSKQTAEFVYRLQKHGFQWEDESYEVLAEKYPNAKAALKWWCDAKGDGSQFSIKKNRYLKEFMLQNHPKFKISSKCCQYAKKDLVHNIIREGGYDMSIIGVRKSEGGVRATSYHSCFDENGGTYDNYRPIFWYTNNDRREYEEHYGVTHSRCYTEYGLKRTGCAGCPYAGRNLEFELEVMEKYEPELFKAVNKVFKDSYEYTRQYKQFVAEQKAKERENEK